MGSMAAIQAVNWLLGSILLGAHAAPVPLPLVNRPQVEAAGLTIYWDRSVVLLAGEHISRITRLDENLYAITDQGRVITLDAATGVQRWVAKIAAPNIRIEGPTHGPAMVLFATALGLQGLDRATGESRLKWKGDFVPTSGISSDGQMIFGGDGDSRVTALQLQDMQIAWEFMTDGLVRSTPILLGPNVFAVSDGGRIYAATKKDKTQVWPIQNVGRISAAPSIYGGNLYVVTLHQSLYCFDLVSGQQRWQSRMPAPLTTSPRATSHAVYQPMAQAGLFCLDPANGSTRWSLPEGTDLAAEIGNLAWLMSGRSCLIGCDRKDGRIRHEIACHADMWVPNDTDDAIFLGNSTGQLMCIRPAGAGFLRYRTVMETTARVGTSQPASPPAAQEPARKAPPAADYLRDDGAIPPVAGSSRTPAPQPGQ